MDIVQIQAERKFFGPACECDNFHDHDAINILFCACKLLVCINEYCSLPKSPTKLYQFCHSNIKL